MRKTDGKSNCFKLCWKLFLLVCKSPTLLLTFHETEISWLFYDFSICFVSFYIIFVKAEFFHLNLHLQKEKNLRGNVVYKTMAIRV